MTQRFFSGLWGTFYEPVPSPLSLLTLSRSGSESSAESESESESESEKSISPHLDEFYGNGIVILPSLNSKSKNIVKPVCIPVNKITTISHHNPPKDDILPGKFWFDIQTTGGHCVVASDLEWDDFVNRVFSTNDGYDTDEDDYDSQYDVSEEEDNEVEKVGEEDKPEGFDAVIDE